MVGIEIGTRSKAFDWNRLKRERVINDVVGGTPVVLVLAADGASFFALERPDAETRFALEEETLVSPAGVYSASGSGPDRRAAELSAPARSSGTAGAASIRTRSGTRGAIRPPQA